MSSRHTFGGRRQMSELSPNSEMDFQLQIDQSNEWRLLVHRSVQLIWLRVRLLGMSIDLILSIKNHSYLRLDFVRVQLTGEIVPSPTGKNSSSSFITTPISSPLCPSKVPLEASACVFYTEGGIHD